MNENAIQDVYNLFVKDGYSDSIDDFKELLKTNEDAVNDAYQLFVDDGYGDTILDFVELMGIAPEKKKPVTPGTGEEEVMASDTTVVEGPGSSEPSLQPSREEVDSTLNVGNEDVQLEETEQDTINIGQGNEVDPNNLMQPETLSTKEEEFVTPKANATEDFFEQSLTQITPDLIAKTEENVVPLMNYHFNDYGFTFKEADFTGDEMKVIAANGEELKVELDALFFKKRYANELTEFLKKNRAESEALYQLENGYVLKKQKIQSKENVEDMVQSFNEETNLVRDNIKKYLEAKNFYDSNNLADRDPEEVIYVEGPNGEQLATTPKRLLEELTIAQSTIASSKKTLAQKGKDLDAAVGAWYEMRSKQRSVLGFGYNALLDGSARIASETANKMIDLGTWIAPKEGGLMSKREYRTRVLTKAREKGILGDTYTDKRIQQIISDDEEYNSMLEILDEAKGTEREIKVAGSIKDGIPASTRKVSTSVLDDIESEILDEARKQIKYDVKPGEEQFANPFSQFANDPMYDGKMGMLDAVRQGQREVLGMDETTKEATQEAKKTFWGGALIGVTESIPAMIGPTPIRLYSMISQVQDHVNEEMQNDPDFQDISEGEKMMFTVPLGIVVGVLENIGFRNAIAQKGLASKILLRVLKKRGKDITGQNFRQVVKKEVNSMMAQGLLLVTASGLAEFETGLAQEIADIGFKEAYNAMKEKEMFRTPESFADGVKQVIRAGAQEAVGGYVIGTPSAVIQTATAGDFTALSDDVFRMYEDIHNEPIVRDAFVEKVKQRILNNEITKKEGEREIQMYDQINGVMNQIPTDLPTKQKKELLGNLLRQQELQDDIDKYNQQLTKRQQREKQELENDVERIVREGQTQMQEDAKETELNTQAINELKEEGIENPTPEQIKTKKDAIQKSSTEKVDVQESTEGSQEVGDGNTSREVTEESELGTKNDLDSQTQKEVDDLTSIINEQTGVQEETETETETTTDQIKTKGVEVDSENDNVTITKSDGTTVNIPGVSVSENVTVTETAGDPKAVRIIPSLLRQAKNAGKAIAKLIPETNIVIHATEDAYNQAVSEANKGTRGTFSPTTNTIHINAPKANTRTVAHEVMHAVLLKRLGINADFSKVTGRMLKAVSKGIKDPELKKTIEAFAADYDTKDQNEEQVAELFGYLSAAYTKLDGPTKSVIKRWLKKAAKAVGLPVNITEFTKEEADMIEFFNTVSKKVREGTEVTEGDIEVIEDGTVPIGDPTTINEPSTKEKKQIEFKESYNMSLVTPENKIDLLGLIDNIVKNDEKVWFWVADQLGKGDFNGIEMDAGPSYALDPTNLAANIIWASGMQPSQMANNVKKADYIFIISGSPTASKLFNKRVYDAYANQLGDYAQFKKEALATNPVKAIRDVLNKYDSWPALRRNQDRKVFLSAIVQQESTPNTDFHKLIKSKDGFIDLNSLRDGFYQENNFEQNDVMLVLKPTAVGGKSNHSTYETNILGEVVGVPDVKLDAFEIMPADIRAKYEGRGRPVKAQVVAPYGSGVKKISKPAPKTESTSEEKAQKAGLDKLVKMYNMNSKGFIGPNIHSLGALRNWAASLGFTVDEARIREGYGRGRLTGYYLRKNGKFFNPRSNEKAQRSVDEKAQKTFNKFDSPREIINKARELNFTDAAITDYLTRVRKFGKREIKELMILNKDLLSIIPPALGNVKGGMKAGIKLFNKVSTHYNKLLAKNAKAKVKLSEQEIMDQAMDFFRSQPEYKALKEKGLKGTSTDQMVLEMDVAKALGGKQSNDLNASIRNARIILKAKTKGEKQLRKIQRELRNFMRKTLPADIYTKSEALRLMKDIEQASKDNIQQVMNEVLEFAAVKNNIRLEKSITDLLDPANTLKKISNVLKGVKIDEGTRKRLANIKKRIDDAKTVFNKETGKKEKATADTVIEYLNDLETEYNELLKNPVKSESDYTAMADLQIIMNMVNANELMSNDDLTKVNVLAGVDTELKQIVTAGRTLLKEQLQKAHLEYRRQFEQVFLDVTGRTESFKKQAIQELKDEGIENPTDAEINDKVTDIIEKLRATIDSRSRDESGTSKKKITVKERFKNLANGIVQSLGNVMAKNSDLFLLMDKISLLPAELFEGNTQEEVTKKIDAANREFKGRMLMNDALIISKLQELFGKKYKSVVTSFGRKTEAIDLPDGTEMVLSPNQMYYLYNQYKDDANHPGLQKTFSTDQAGLTNVMNEITSRLESDQYKELKEFADWQVDVLYPLLYSHYNKAYENIYRTQMPYNVNYAGMVYRDGQEAEGVNLIPGKDGGKIQYHNVVAANSTKMREQNSKKIKAMDGTNVLYTYMRDMEYFSAYARPINDINKLFTNDIIKSEIERLHGKTTMVAIDAAIQKIANKGTFKTDTQMDEAVDIMQDMFILSRLGINPVVTLKQLTSFLTFASDIGYGNWMKNAALSRFAKGQGVKEIWKEISENSTYLKDRDAKSMTKAIEMYSDKGMENVFPDIKIRGQRIMSGANKETLIDILMYTTKIGDRGAIFLGGVPNYVHYKNEFKKKNPNASEQEAIDYAIVKFERDTKRSQQSTDLQDRDYYQTRGPIFRALNMFLTTPKQYLRKEAYAIRNAYRLMSSGGKSGKGTKADAGRIFLTYHVIMPVFFQWVANGMPGFLADWEDEDSKDLATAAILGNINALFLYGDFAVMLKNLLSDKPETFLNADSLPILTQGSEIFKKFSRYRKLKDPQKKQEALYAALAEASQITGLPVNNLRKIFKNMEELIDGGEDPEKVIMRLFNYSEYQIQNEAERKRNNKRKRKATKKVKKEVEDNTIFQEGRKNENAIFNTGTKNEDAVFKKGKKNEDAIFK